MKHKIVLSSCFVALLITAPAAMAETRSCQGVIECTVKGAFKLGKRIVTPVIIIGGGAADAGEKFLEGGNAGEVIEAGITGAGENAAEAITETFEDATSVTKATFKAIGDVISWASK